MPNTDLCTAAERSEIHIVIERSLTRLKGKSFLNGDCNRMPFLNILWKGTDKQLPQIARMRDFLSRGVAVHHGGLLPIVKEVSCCFASTF